VIAGSATPNWVGISVNRRFVQWALQLMARSQLKMQLEKQSSQSDVARRTGKITLQSLILLGISINRLTQRR
jgi:hypothetical protein